MLGTQAEGNEERYRCLRRKRSRAPARAVSLACTHRPTSSCCGSTSHPLGEADLISFIPFSTSRIWRARTALILLSFPPMSLLCCARASLLARSRSPGLLVARVRLHGRFKSIASSEAPVMPPPLSGIRIVDLTRVLAGPTATMLLADLGYVITIYLAHADTYYDRCCHLPPDSERM